MLEVYYGWQIGGSVKSLGEKVTGLDAREVCVDGLAHSQSTLGVLLGEVRETARAQRDQQPSRHSRRYDLRDGRGEGSTHDGGLCAKITAELGG